MLTCRYAVVLTTLAAVAASTCAGVHAIRVQAAVPGAHVHVCCTAAMLRPDIDTTCTRHGFARAALDN